MKRRAEFFDTIRYFFDFQRNRTGKSILLFLSGLISLGWLVNTVYGLFNFLGKLIVECIRGEQLVDKRLTLFYSALFDVGLAALSFYLVYRIMKNHLRRSLPMSEKIEFETPAPHRGLIFLLSTYKPGDSVFGAFDRIYLDDENHARYELLKSNWGALVIACQHHASILECCWLICTEGDNGSAEQFEVAESIIKKFAGQNIRCQKVKLFNLNDVSEVVGLIEDIYHQAPLAQDLMPDQIIADFTGGTAAMSGGMILATVLEDRKIEYVTQNPYKLPFRKEGSAMTPKEIADANILITIVTTPKLLPTKPSGPQADKL
jgi:hypothetical protein